MREAAVAEQANRELRVELAGILLFLPGLGFLVAGLVLLATAFVSHVLPEEAGSLPPGLDFGFWPVLIGVLVLLVPAVLFMSAGVVLRRFLRS
jgi:O-antigen/teichoic acid export membrane protein